MTTRDLTGFVITSIGPYFEPCMVQGRPYVIEEMVSNNKFRFICEQMRKRGTPTCTTCSNGRAWYFSKGDFKILRPELKVGDRITPTCSDDFPCMKPGSQYLVESIYTTDSFGYPIFSVVACDRPGCCAGRDKRYAFDDLFSFYIPPWTPTQEDMKKALSLPDPMDAIKFLTRS